MCRELRKSGFIEGENDEKGEEGFARENFFFLNVLFGPQATLKNKSYI